MFLFGLAYGYSCVVKVNEKGSHAPLSDCFSWVSEEFHRPFLVQATPAAMIRDKNDRKSNTIV